MRKSVFLAILVIFLSLWMSCENNGQSPATETEAAAVAAELKAHELIQNAIKEESDESIKVNFILPDAKAIGEEILSAEVTFSGYRHGTVLIESGMLVYRFYGYSSSSRYIYPQSYSVETINALQVRSESVGKAVDITLSVSEDLNADVDGYISTDGGYKLPNNFMLYIPYGCSGTADGNPFDIDEARKPVIEDKKEITAVRAYVDVRKDAADSELPTDATAFIVYDDNTEEERNVSLNGALDVSSSGIYADTNTITIEGKSYPVEVFVYDYKIAELYALLNMDIAGIRDVQGMIAWIRSDAEKYVYVPDGTSIESVGIPGKVSIQAYNLEFDLKNLYFRGQNTDATVYVASENNPSFLEVSASDVTFDGLDLDFTDAPLIGGQNYNAIIIGPSKGQQVSTTSNLTVKDCSIIGADKVAFGISIPEYSSGVSIINTMITGCDTSLILRNDTSLEDVTVDSGISIIVSEPDKLDSIEFKDVVALADDITVTVTAPETMESDVDSWIEAAKTKAPSFVYDRKLQEDLDIGGAEITPWEDGGSFDVEAGM